MRHHILTICLAAALCVPAKAQTINDVLREIEQNNLALKSAGSSVEAQKNEARAGIMLDDPEVEFNYLFGNNDIGRRHDLKVTQSFDFSALAGAKARQFKAEAGLLDLEYLNVRSAVLAAAEQICVDIVYYNALIAFMEEHISTAEALKASTLKRVEYGDGSRFDVSKNVLHLSALKSRLASLVEDRNELLLQLTALNGSKPVSFYVKSYSDVPVEAVPSLDEYIGKVTEVNPRLRYARAKVAVDEGALRLDKAAWAPRLTVGYMSEITRDEGFRGVTLGVSIPLWKNSSKVKQSRARVAASKYEAEDTYIDMISSLTSLHARMESMEKVSREAWSAIEEAGHADYLEKARKQGEISIIEFFMEMDLFYEAYEGALDSERAYRTAVAGLNAYLR